MENEKRNRIVAAVTVNVILLIAILAFVVGYQIIAIVKTSQRKNDLKSQLDYWKKITQDTEESLGYWESPEGLEDLAYEFGFVYGK